MIDSFPASLSITWRNKKVWASYCVYQGSPGWKPFTHIRYPHPYRVRALHYCGFEAFHTGILHILSLRLYFLKVSWAFGKREIIANAALIICPCFDRFPRSTSTKLVNPNDLRNTSAKIPRPTPKAVLIHKHPHVLTVKCYLLILNNLLFCAGTMRMVGIMNIFTDNKLHFAPYLRSWKHRGQSYALGYNSMFVK